MELAKIATYLNVATLKIKEGQPALQWLTGAITNMDYEVTAQSQETQCLSWGSTLWIANNEDLDTTTQNTFVDTLGITKAQKLLEHVVRYGKRPLPRRPNGNVNTDALTMKQTLLYALVGGANPDPGAVCVLPGAAANPTFNAANEGQNVAAPAVSAIVFVRGAYVGTNADAACHAEQKLLAALGLAIQRGVVVAGDVAVGGIKTACGTCEGVLTAVRRRLNELERGINLQFESRRLTDMRNDAGLGADANGGIRPLDVAHYFG